jgi:hypothetical protein
MIFKLFALVMALGLSECSYGSPNGLDGGNYTCSDVAGNWFFLGLPGTDKATHPLPDLVEFTHLDKQLGFGALYFHDGEGLLALAEKLRPSVDQIEYGKCFTKEGTLVWEYMSFRVKAKLTGI